MSDIPEDIIKAANECVANFRWSNDNQWDRFVAQAILAERNRCAKIADDEAERRFDNKGGYPAARVHDFLVVARSIAAAIRG